MLKQTVHQVKENFRNHFNVTEVDMSYLWRLFMEYGMTKGAASHRTKGNHYFLQGICEHTVVEWSLWNKKLSTEIRQIIMEKYPEFMVDNKDFCTDNL